MIHLLVCWGTEIIARTYWTVKFFSQKLPSDLNILLGVEKHGEYERKSYRLSSIHEKTGEGLTIEIVSKLQLNHLVIDVIRGQSYYNGANMA